MKATQQLCDAGQNLWLVNITAALPSKEKLQRCIDELSVTGLTSNLTIFEPAIRNRHDCDSAIRARMDSRISSGQISCA